MSRRLLTASLLAMAAGVSAVAVLGPLVTGVLQHRASPGAVDQLLGTDLTALLLVAPLCLGVAALVWRGHPAAPVLALAPAAYVTYSVPQVVLGQQYLVLPGDVERFFPLLVGLFVVGAGTLLGCWSATRDPSLPVPSRRLEVAAGTTLLLVSAFLVLGLHLRTLLDAMGPTPSTPEYLADPTAFWLVKFMDLAIVVPVAVVTGVALLRGRTWARAPMYAVLGGYSLLAIAVVAMGVVMQVEDDPGASLGLTLGLAGFAVALLSLSVLLYRPLLRRPPAPVPTPLDPASFLSDATAHTVGS